MKTLYTFGYLSAKAERMINEFIAVKTPLVDIRFSPTSRNWRYTQGFLQTRPGVIYVHIVELGNELYKQALSGDSQEPHIKLHNPETGLIRLEEVLRAHGRAAIFCACTSKKKCHRTVVAELAKERFGVNIVHL
jgi:uncharacterized protein (DUF488 family)